jgi:hypothetical protein
MMEREEWGKPWKLRSARKRSFLSFPTYLTFLTFTTFLACRGPRQNVEAGAAPEAERFSLVLNNHQVLDANVFIQHDGQVDRVGMVSASSSRVLELPLWMLGQSRLIRLIAEPIGNDERYTSDFLLVQPGQVVELNVEGVLQRSNYSIE